MRVFAGLEREAIRSELEYSTSEGMTLQAVGGRSEYSRHVTAESPASTSLHGLQSHLIIRTIFPLILYLHHQFSASKASRHAEERYIPYLLLRRQEDPNTDFSLTAKSRTIAVRLVSMAMTGYYKTFVRPRLHRPLSMMKYDPVGESLSSRSLDPVVRRLGNLDSGHGVWLAVRSVLGCLVDAVTTEHGKS